VACHNDKSPGAIRKELHDMNKMLGSAFFVNLSPLIMRSLSYTNTDMHTTFVWHNSRNPTCMPADLVRCVQHVHSPQSGVAVHILMPGDYIVYGDNYRDVVAKTMRFTDQDSMLPRWLMLMQHKDDDMIQVHALASVSVLNQNDGYALRFFGILEVQGYDIDHACYVNTSPESVLFELKVLMELTAAALLAEEEDCVDTSNKSMHDMQNHTIQALCGDHSTYHTRGGHMWWPKQVEKRGVVWTFAQCGYAIGPLRHFVAVLGAQMGLHGDDAIGARAISINGVMECRRLKATVDRAAQRLSLHDCWDTSLVNPNDGVDPAYMELSADEMELLRLAIPKPGRRNNLLRELHCTNEGQENRMAVFKGWQGSCTVHSRASLAWNTSARENAQLNKVLGEHVQVCAGHSIRAQGDAALDGRGVGGCWGRRQGRQKSVSYIYTHVSVVALVVIWLIHSCLIACTSRHRLLYDMISILSLCDMRHCSSRMLMNGSMHVR